MGPSNGTLDLALDAVPVKSDPVPAPVAQRKVVPFNESEEHRHACEVRFLHAMGAKLGAERARDYCRGVEKHRGRPAAERLWDEARALNKKPDINNDHA